MDFMEFGDIDTQNDKIYTVTIFGIPNFRSSITIVHRFFDVFKVTSMLTRVVTSDWLTHHSNGTPNGAP